MFPTHRCAEKYEFFLWQLFIFALPFTFHVSIFLYLSVINCRRIYECVWPFMGLALKGLLRLAITLNPICNCGTAEGTIHYLHFPNFSNERLTLFNKFQNIVENIISKNDFNILNVRKHSFNDVKKYFCFNCFNWIHNFSKAFWCFLVSKLALIYLFMCSLFLVFRKNFLVHFFYLVLYFL